MNGDRELHQLTNWVRGLVVLVIVVAVACTVLFFRVQDRAQENRALAASIQTQRADGYRRSCEEQNARHDRTVDRLLALVKANGKPASAAQPTITLIDALAPVKDCDRLVQDRVQRP